MRERDVPRRSRAERLLVEERLLDERAVRLEHLDAIVDAIADVQQPIDREIGAVHRIAELLRRRRVRIVPSEIHIVGLVAVGAPVPLVLAGVGVEHDDAMVAVAVGDVQLVGLLVDEGLGRQPQIRDVVAALARSRLADLHQEFAVLRELQHHVVVERLRAGRLALVLLTVLSGGRRRRAPRAGGDAAAVAADPHVAADSRP